MSPEQDEPDEPFEEEFAADTRQYVAPVPRPEAGFLRPNGMEYIPRQIMSIQDIAFLRRAKEKGEPVLLYGPPGTGKTALFEAAYYPDRLVDEDGLLVHAGVETIVGSVDTRESDFFGTFAQDPETGRYLWVPGPLQRAVEYGIPLFVDEIFVIDQRVLTSTLFPLMDGRNVLRIAMNPTLPPIPVHPGFIVLGAGNPDLPGANYSEALRDRFDHQIEVETAWEMARAQGVPQNLINVAKRLNVERRERRISWSPQLRSLLKFRDNKAAYGKDYAYGALLGKTPERDRSVVAAALVKGISGLEKVEALEMGDRFTR